jgi:hypothetical protein
MFCFSFTNHILELNNSMEESYPEAGYNGRTSYLLNTGFLLGLLLDLEDKGKLFTESLVDFQRTMRLITKKTELFITTCLRTSNSASKITLSTKLWSANSTLSFRFSDKNSLCDGKVVPVLN